MHEQTQKSHQMPKANHSFPRKADGTIDKRYLRGEARITSLLPRKADGTIDKRYLRGEARQSSGSCRGNTFAEDPQTKGWIFTYPTTIRWSSPAGGK